jgi:zinc protease
MKTAFSTLLLVAAAAFASAATSAKSAFPDVDIPYTRYVLPNGLTLIVNEDHKAPIVAFNVWYHVGSKDERPGRTGFAHLFEHLMFNGSENFNDDYFKPLEPVGATKMNGNTWLDRTVYFENVPTSALDMTLWLESDRMGHLLGAIDQKKLDEQRGVVQNEKRQGENQPYGKVDELIAYSTYPAGHPYSWETIGSMEDLNAASLEDVKSWFRAYYGAASRTLLRRHRTRPRDQAPGRMDRQDERHPPRHDARQRASGAHLQDLEHSRLQDSGLRHTRFEQRHPRQQQEQPPLQTPRLSVSDRHFGAGRRRSI